MKGIHFSSDNRHPRSLIPLKLPTADWLFEATDLVFLGFWRLLTFKFYMRTKKKITSMSNAGITFNKHVTWYWISNKITDSNNRFLNKQMLLGVMGGGYRSYKWFFYKFFLIYSKWYYIPSLSLYVISVYGGHNILNDQFILLINWLIYIKLIFITLIKSKIVTGATIRK